MKRGFFHWSILFSSLYADARLRGILNLGPWAVITRWRDFSCPESQALRVRCPGGDPRRPGAHRGGARGASRGPRRAREGAQRVRERVATSRTGRGSGDRRAVTDRRLGPLRQHVLPLWRASSPLRRGAVLSDLRDLDQGRGRARSDSARWISARLGRVRRVVQVAGTRPAGRLSYAVPRNILGAIRA
jgi:hypothetical protein